MISKHQTALEEELLQRWLEPAVTALQRQGLQRATQTAVGSSFGALQREWEHQVGPLRALAARGCRRSLKPLAGPPETRLRRLYSAGGPGRPGPAAAAGPGRSAGTPPCPEGRLCPASRSPTYVHIQSCLNRVPFFMHPHLERHYRGHSNHRKGRNNLTSTTSMTACPCGQPASHPW